MLAQRHGAAAPGTVVWTCAILWGRRTVKVAIFAGGKGSRLIEETRVRPKPLVEIGNRPILWHIMQHYSAHGHHEFVLALGYMAT